MHLSVFDLFKIGVGPSSSHTVGPMVAAKKFVENLDFNKLLDQVARVRVDLFGSLAMTGKGHLTDKAILMGLMGYHPATIDPAIITQTCADIEENHKISLNRTKHIQFNVKESLLFHYSFKPIHSNAMEFHAFDHSGREIALEEYYSIGGGFIATEAELKLGDNKSPTANRTVKFEFTSGDDLLKIGAEHGLSFAEILLENERTWRSDGEIMQGLDNIWSIMDDSIKRGIKAEGELPGGLRVKRRAKRIVDNLHNEQMNFLNSQGKELSNLSRLPMKTMDWVNVFALAVNEENAAGGRVVTAPTNGAAGVIPAVIAYYDRFVTGANQDGIRTMLLTAAAIGMLYKHNASLSAAEVGCQGEVGVACSMAAGALCAALGGNNYQIENAAEIGMEHNLGLTCDPIKGLVQIPCIERNTMGAVKAINAARLALHGDGAHFVSLDKVIATMYATGKDMLNKYKETSEGGLAAQLSVALPEC